MNSQAQNVLQALNETEYLYHRLVLLVGETGSGKTTVLQKVCNNLDITLVNLNLELSQLMVEMTAKLRTLQLPKILEDLVNKKDGKTIAIDNIEILFDVNLQQDPLRLLQKISRNKNIIVSWNGIVNNGKLMYAVPGHPEYRNYDKSDLFIIPMQKQNNF
jgi:chromosomal replication initiation ATPase DnaA